MSACSFPLLILLLTTSRRDSVPLISLFCFSTPLIDLAKPPAAPNGRDNPTQTMSRAGPSQAMASQGMASQRAPVSCLLSATLADDADSCRRDGGRASLCAVAARDRAEACELSRRPSPLAPSPFTLASSPDPLSFFPQHAPRCSFYYHLLPSLSLPSATEPQRQPP